MAQLSDTSISGSLEMINGYITGSIIGSDANFTSITASSIAAETISGAVAGPASYLGKKVDNTGIIVSFPESGYYYTGDVSTAGYIAILLPTDISSAMFRFTFKVYEYQAGSSFDVTCGGYYTNGDWLLPFAYMTSQPSTSRNHDISFAKIGSRAAVIVRTIESWSHTTIVVTEVIQNGSALNETVDTWNSGFEATITGSLDEFTTVQTVTNPSITLSTVGIVEKASAFDHTGGNVANEDSFIIHDIGSGKPKRILASNISLSAFNNDAGFGIGDVTAAGNNAFTGTNTFNANYITGSITGSDAKFGSITGSLSGNASTVTNGIYTTNISSYATTAVTAGAGLSGGGTVGALTLDLDFSELTDKTTDITGTTEFILQDGETESKKAASEIKLSVFNNDSSWTSNVGTVTSVDTGTGLTGGTITDIGTISLTGQALALHSLSTSGLIARTGAGAIQTITLAEGVGIDVTNGDGNSGNPTVALDLSEVPDVTATMVGTDEFVILDDSSQGRKAANEIGLSIFNNDAGFGIGNIESVVGGFGLNGEGTSGIVTLNLDFSELSDMTGDITGTTEFILQDGETESRKAASEIKLSNFNNDSGWTSNAGTVTSVDTGTGLTGGTITDIGTVSLTGQALALHNLSTNGLIARTGTGTVAGRILTEGVGIDVTNGDGVSGNPTVTLDLSEVPDVTATMAGTDEFIILDASSQGRKAANEIGLSIFNNDAGFVATNTSNTFTSTNTFTQTINGSITGGASYLGKKVDNTSIIVSFPESGYYYTGVSSTGYIVILLPTNISAAMFRLTFKVHEYQAGSSFEVTCGGYYSSGTWASQFAYMSSQPNTNRNHDISFAYIGSRAAVIVNTNETWNYTTIAVTEVIQGGYLLDETVDTWNSGLQATITGSLDEFTTVQTVTSPAVTNLNTAAITEEANVFDHTGGTIASEDSFVIHDIGNNSARRMLASRIPLTAFNNDAGFVTATGNNTFTGTNTFGTIRANLHVDGTTITASTYSVTSADFGKTILFNRSSTQTVTFPSGLATGFNLTMIQIGTGTITVQASSGVTLVNRNSHNSSSGQYASISVIVLNSSTYILIGDTA